MPLCNTQDNTGQSELTVKMTEMLSMVDEKLREVLHPVAYTVLVVILQLLSQVFYAAREGVKSLNPKFFGKSVRGDIVFLTGMYPPQQH